MHRSSEDGPIRVVDWGPLATGRGRHYRRYHEIKPPGQPGRAWPNLTQVRKEAGPRGVIVHYLNHLGEYVPFKWIVHKDAEREAKARLRHPPEET